MSADKKRGWAKHFRTRIAAGLIAGAVAAGVIVPIGAASHVSRITHVAATAGTAITRGVLAATSTATRTFIPSAASTTIGSVTEQLAQAVFASRLPFGDIIWREAKKNALAPELVAAVVRQESQFKPAARSYRGALGLMQLLPATGRWMGATNLLNPQENIAAGTKYLRYLYDEFGNNEQKVIAAYNAGDGNVRRFGGLPPFRETRKYVSNVLRFRDEFHSELAAAAGANVGS